MWAAPGADARAGGPSSDARADALTATVAAAEPALSQRDPAPISPMRGGKVTGGG